jgi:hypothetical protein
MAGGPTRQDTWECNVWVAGRKLGKEGWDKRSGGELDSEEYKFSPGAMAPSVSLGGRKTIGNITVSRLYRLVRDHQNLLQFLYNHVGKASMTVSQQPLDIDGNTFGKPIVWHGTLKRVTVPEMDSEGSDAALIELEMTVEGEPHVG